MTHIGAELSDSQTYLPLSAEGEEEGGMVRGASLIREIKLGPGFLGTIKPEVLASPSLDRYSVPYDPLLAEAEKDPNSIFCPERAGGSVCEIAYPNTVSLKRRWFALKIVRLLKRSLSEEAA